MFRGEGGGGRVTELPARRSLLHDGRVTELCVEQNVVNNRIG